MKQWVRVYYRSSDGVVGHVATQTTPFETAGAEPVEEPGQVLEAEDLVLEDDGTPAVVHANDIYQHIQRRAGMADIKVPADAQARVATRVRLADGTEAATEGAVVHRPRDEAGPAHEWKRGAPEELTKRVLRKPKPDGT